MAKLEGMADKLKRGENVQNRQLQTWLSEDEYAQLEYEWKEQLELRSELKDKPNDLKRYEEKLREATFNYNRGEGYSSKGKQDTAKTFYNKSESLCEDQHYGRCMTATERHTQLGKRFIELSEQCHKQINTDAVGWWKDEVRV